MNILKLVNVYKKIKVKNKEIFILEDISKDISKKKKITRFIKPTIEEIKAYCDERKNNIDPEYFFNYNEARGWMLGKTHMKDWKATIRTWEKKEKEKNYQPKQEQKNQVMIFH